MNFSSEIQEEANEYLAVANEEPFRQIPISEWQGQDCQQWVHSLLNRQRYYHDGSIIWRFKDFTGQQLLQFTKQDFIALGKDLGRYLFKELQHLRRKQREMNIVQLQSESSQGEPFEDPFLRYNTSPSQDFSKSIPGGFQHQNIGGRYSDPDIDLLEAFPEVEVSDYENLDVGLLEEILDEVNLEDTEDLSFYNHIQYGSKQEDSYLQHQYPKESLNHLSESFPEDALSPSTPSASAMSIPSEHLSNIPVGHRRRERGPKNWEYLMRLLADPRTNPTFIKWEDEATGAFRLMQPEAIARTWASRNEKGTDLTYNNFARGLRYHYKNKIIFPKREKQMVYGCGQKARKFLEDLKDSTR